MADIHDRGKALAKKMLAARPKGKGLTLSLIKREVGAYDPVEGGQTEVKTTYSGSGLRSSYDEADVDGTYILQGDVRILLSPVLQSGADTPHPSTNDVIEFDGSRYSIIGIRAWNFAGVDCGWSLQCRGL